MKQQVGAGLGAALLVWAFGASAKDSSMPTTAQERVITKECAALLEQAGVLRNLQMAKVLVQSQGMRLVMQACPYVRTQPGEVQQVLDVRVLVVDSETAANFVRGPLGDGEEVDMGDVHLGLPEEVAVAESDISPDVQYNREWLSKLMQGRGWRAVTGHWWAFIPGLDKK